ncbi:DUF4340 domain-containing protein [Breznakiellaceae bacterium SP9]
MEYRKKATLLSSVLALLLVVYAGTVFFDPDAVNMRDAAYTWLDQKASALADRIEIHHDGQTLVLVRKNKVWFALLDDVEVPARQYRIDDLLRSLSTPGSYPVRATEASSHERLSLNEGSAARLLIQGGPGTFPLLDLFIGREDAAGAGIYLRKNGHDEVRSGEDKLSSYIQSAKTAWYNLRLFPDAEDNSLNPARVQHLSLFWKQAAAAPIEQSLVLTRNNQGWLLNNDAAISINAPIAEAYIRSILDTEAENFTMELTTADPIFTDARLILDLDDGRSRTLRFSPPDEQNRRHVIVSGADYVYTLAAWTVGRIFREADYFQ